MAHFSVLAFNIATYLSAFSYAINQIKNSYLICNYCIFLNTFHTIKIYLMTRTQLKC